MNYSEIKNMSKGQFYDSDEEQGVGEAEENTLQLQYYSGPCAFQRAVVVADDIGDVLCESLIHQLHLELVGKVNLQNHCLAELYGAHPGGEVDINDRFVLIWIRHKPPVDHMASLCRSLEGFGIHYWFVVDALHCHHFSRNMQDSQLDHIHGLRSITGKSRPSFWESHIPRLESGIMVQGLTANIINWCDVRSDYECAAVIVIRETAFTVEAAQSLEAALVCLEKFLQGYLSGRKLQTPEIRQYRDRRKTDAFLIHTDNLYS